jgi:hypothetical protein
VGGLLVLITLCWFGDGILPNLELAGLQGVGFLAGVLPAEAFVALQVELLVLLVAALANMVWLLLRCTLL